MTTPDIWLKTALLLHRRGEARAAEAWYRKVLVADVHQAMALNMLAIILINAEQLDEAESLLRRRLVTDADDAFSLHNLGRLLQTQGQDRLALDYLQRAAANEKRLLAPIYNDIGVSLQRLSRRDEALVAFDFALRQDPGYCTAHDNRGLVLAAGGRYAEAIAAHRTAYSLLPADATVRQRTAVLYHLAESCQQIRDHFAAQQACEAILSVDEDHEAALLLYCRVLLSVQQDVRAIALLDRLARRRGLVRDGSLVASAATVLLLGGVGAEHVPTRYIIDSTVFATLELTLVAPGQPDYPLGSVDYAELAGVDLIFNTLGEVAKDGGHGGAVAALAERLGKPVINSPRSVARTGRDRAQELFGDIPGLVVPEVCRIARPDGCDLGKLSTFPYPVLVRPVGSHGGRDLELVHTPAEMQAYLGRVEDEEFLVTNFHDFQDGAGYYRKYRLVFVDRVAFAYHLAIHDHWLVHYWRGGRQGDDDWMRREEDAFLRDWRAVFGTRASSVVEEVGRRLDLDYGGLDCAVLADGRVLFFEANACMLVHLDDAVSEAPCKHQAVPKIRDAMTRMIKKRMGDR